MYYCMYYSLKIYINVYGVWCFFHAIYDKYFVEKSEVGIVTLMEKHNWKLSKILLLSGFYYQKYTILKERNKHFAIPRQPIVQIPIKN